MPTRPTIAIVNPCALTGIGLKAILEKVIPMADVELFGDFDDFVAADPTRFFHFFVSGEVFAAHAGFFGERRHQTILLTADGAQVEGMHCLNTCAGEESLVHEILRMHHGAHHHDHDAAVEPPRRTSLTDREIEVLRLLARGYINKQIADQLHIALTTVISHRRNLSEKLGIRSVAGLAIYALRAGYVDEESL